MDLYYFLYMRKNEAGKGQGEVALQIGRGGMKTSGDAPVHGLSMYYESVGDGARPDR